VPQDEPLLSHIRKKRTFSIASYDSDYAVFANELPEGTYEYSFYASGNLLKKITGDSPLYHIKEALGFALSVFSECRLPFDMISSFKLPYELLHTKIITYKDMKILDDSYNSSLESIEYAMRTLFRIKANRHIVLLSDTHETYNPEQYHENIGKAVAHFSPDLILLYGKYAKSIRAGALAVGYEKENIRILSDGYSAADAAKLTRPLLSRFDALLIKGSHGTDAYKIASLLTKE